MRAVIITDHADTSGGAPAVAVQSALGLAEFGVPTAVIHAVAEQPDLRLGGAGIARVPLGLTEVWDRPAASAAVQGIWNRVAASRLAAALDELTGPGTVLHLHQWTKALSPSIFPVLLRSGLPVVVTLHDYFLACPTGLYYRFDRDAPCTLVPLSASCAVAPCDPRTMAHKAVRLLRSVATRAAIRNAPLHVIHVSDRSRRTIGDLLPRTIRQHRIDNPVPAERLEPAEIGPGSRVAYIGRLTHEKGVEIAAAACAAAGLPALFIGEGPAEAAIRRLHVGAEITGWRSQAEVEHLLRTEVRAILAPSLWEETGPLAVPEAMAAGIPPIVSIRAGAAEWVRHGETGLVVEPEMEPLADAVRRMSDLLEARRIGRAAYDSFWDRPPTRRAHAEALVELYAGLLAGRD